MDAKELLYLIELLGRQMPIRRANLAAIYFLKLLSEYLRAKELIQIDDLVEMKISTRCFYFLK